ncbi:hypothetical protein FHT09_000710 [Xanthomonas arboricola]|uniref:hypothetical protein n=1 Tax=Xanthomonas TaxID=338 RepID=UPI000CEDFC2F|nr:MULTISPECIES: hypothetical protein [Xanthomonas]MBB5735011.1 hypothetical protein [Xanthomonas sp. CFBP 8152]
MSTLRQRPGTDNGASGQNKPGLEWTLLPALRNQVRINDVERGYFALESADKIDPTRLNH